MSKMEYMPVDCLQVPKMLFQVEEFKNLSNTAKILYSLFLDRLKFAVQNGWVDHNGDLFVIYPKSEMKKDLNTTRYGVDQAVQELVKIGKLVRIVQNDGKANHFYINDIYENEMEEESMMTLDRIMANMQMEEREIIMDKMVAASRDILGTIADMGYLNEYETPLTPMEERGYYDEEGNLDIDAVEADGYEFGMDLAFGVLSIFDTFEGNFSRAAIFIILAVIADSMDGRAARFLGVGGGEFGKELDSLCDLGSFGVAPAILIYQYGMTDLGLLGKLIASIFTICGAMRLARFNVNVGEVKGYFQGMPIPAGACVLATYVLSDYSFSTYFVAILTFVIGCIMYSNVKFPDFKGKGNPMFLPPVIVAAAVGIYLLYVNLSAWPFAAMFTYSLAGIINCVYAKILNKQ